MISDVARMQNSNSKPEIIIPEQISGDATYPNISRVNPEIWELRDAT